MAILSVPMIRSTLTDISEIKSYLDQRGIFYDSWEADIPLNNGSSEEEILRGYEPSLSPYMKQCGYKTADVINLNENTPDYPTIRKKFNQEHTHTDDEVRLFVDGSGLFWFHLNNGEIFNVLCEKGDLISVPAHVRHWFDAGEKPFVKAIRIFIDESGWVPHYTGSEVELAYS